MAHQRTLEKSKYRNWVRGGLAYKYLKEGIEEFVDDVVQQEHSRILNVVNHSHGITCNQCCFRNLQTMHKCHQDPATGRNQCPWGQLKCNCLYPKKKHCPNKICGEIMEEILKCHGSTPPAPNWKNTEMQKWCESPWEIAKCFINAPGYSDKTRASAFDTVGLLHLLINNISLHAHLSSSLIGSDLLNKTLQRRNKLVHSASMEMEDEDLNGCIDDIIAILEDEKELKARHEAQQAVCKLMQLKKENFIITTHNEVEVCRAALQSITKKSKELTQTIQDAKDDISQKTAEATRNIDEKTRKAVQGALEDLTNHTGTLYERVGHVESEIATIKKQLAEKVGTKDELDDIRDHHQKQLKYVQAKHALQDNLVKLYQKHYVKTSISPLKLQENDVNIEEVYVSPEMAVQVNMQHQHKASTSKCCTVSTSEWKTIHRYRDIFQTNDKRHKNIYILGDVGAGKSSFCKMMIQNWCKTITGDSCNYNDNDNTQGHFVTSNMFTDTSVSDTVTTNVLFQEHSVSDIFSNTDERDITDYYRNGFSASTNYVYDYNVISNSSGKNREPRVSDASDIHDDISESETNLTEWSVKPTPGSEFDSDYQYSVDPFLDENNADIQEMRNFDFLFFIPLRSMSGLTSDVTEMIKVIATDADLASDDLIDRIIEQESERCLIIIDGLDEWNPPEDTPIFPHVSFGIPKGDRAKHSTFITLSRGSAKGILNLKSTECDQKIKLQGVNSKSVQYFTDKYMSKLNKADVCSKNFIKKAANFRRGHLERTPLLLQQLVWMYYTGNEIGNSVSDTYSHLVNIMLSWSQNKDVKVLGDYDIGVPDKYKDLQLPKLLNRFSSCEVKKQSLFLLGQVALEVLTSNMNTST
ncbi:uncharacterized protein LOC128554410 [Mercenaria mercenaria]|uniref:uncharacterized protein LOC128554410 n=1 Tax=Mercenaria mercenaria TaxID=6596 RepID=UPI00234F68CC|nr:uncharacterized protein LOC128554410 [Mercenaria mercenaria]